MAKNNPKTRGLKSARARQIRERLGWSRDAFCFFTGLSYVMVQRVEKGDLNVRLDIYIRAAHGLGASVDDIMPGLAFRPKSPIGAAPGKNEPDFAGARRYMDYRRGRKGSTRGPFGRPKKETPDAEETAGCAEGGTEGADPEVDERSEVPAEEGAGNE